MKRGGKTAGKSLAARPRPVPRRKSRARAKIGPARKGADTGLRTELEQKTRALNEALAQQAATADVLKAISGSTFDLAAVLDTLVRSAARLCRADRAAIRLLKDGALHHLASYGFTAQQRDFMIETPVPAEPHRGSIGGRVLIEGKIVQIADSKADPDFRMTVRAGFADVRTVLGVPLLRGDTLIGLFIFSRKAVEPFTGKQISLVQNFAAQAVVAIENARLLSELRESLEQQTATSEVLKVISRSTGDLQPVFDVMLANAVDICGAKFGNLSLFDGHDMRMAARHNAPREFEELRSRDPVVPLDRSILGAVVKTKQVIRVDDLAADETYAKSMLAKVAGARSALAVPMLHEDELVGAIAIYHRDVRPFTNKQIELLANFAAQAVIAIENTRLLNELRQRTGDLTESLEQQTATSEVLRVISSSPGELEPVFQAMLANAVRICDAKFGALFRFDNETFDPVALFDLPPALAEFLRRRGPFRPPAGTPVDRLLQTKDVVRIADDLAEAVPSPAARFGGARTHVAVPMLKDDVLIGAINIYRQEVRPFTDKQIDLVKNFAAQAVIAIENTRLLNELRERTDDLSKSLEDLRAAQDRLVQTEKLASLGQLTAGIAHEIKNPLNFVNNFSSLSVELIDEMQEELGKVTMGDDARAAIADLAGTLKGNLDKIAQHGKRADAIVKNMLLHSREGSGERRPVDVNALVEESLNLAYHGARAEKQGFNIVLERSFDAQAGEADLYPQEVTRVLLNIIANGFYAALKRKAQADGTDFEPTLVVSTRNLGDRVEIRIRDNGTGIPPEVKARIFNPFFTTKPAGEGTGLGLSISHDIIVKQHAGTIAVDTQPGQFTEFAIVLPRRAPSLGKPA